MRRIFISTLLISILLPSILISQKADHVVIAEIYGGGGNSGATYTHDYIVLYNPTDSDVDLSSWSVQYASASGDSWDMTELVGSIMSGCYYIIKQASYTAGNGVELPVTPNVIDNTPLSMTSGKIVLANNQIELDGISDPTGNVTVIDFVGYGSAESYEGSDAAISPSNSSSIRRKDNEGNSTYGTNGSGWDSNDNSVDFYKESDLESNQPLPVELILFNGSASENIVNLIWQTATEVNNYGFDVERKINVESSEWQKIGFAAGSGNSNSIKEYNFTDNCISQSGEYFYRLKQIDIDGGYEYSDPIIISISTPSGFSLEQNYPNPFNPTTQINFKLPTSAHVRLDIYNIAGQRVFTLLNGSMDAGYHSVNFDAGWLSNGIYIYQIRAGKYSDVRKMLLIK